MARLALVWAMAAGCGGREVRLGDGVAGPDGGACPHGQVQASEVLWIGDSWITMTGTQHTGVRDLARAAGAIGPNDDYVVVAIGGTTMAMIADQYNTREAGASKVKVLGLHGMSKDAWKRFSDEGYRHYEVTFAGFKYNMPDITAALGVKQLKNIERYWKRRREIWDHYNAAFDGLPCVLPAEPEPDARHAYHLYTPLIDVDRLGKTRDWVLNALIAENIGAGVH